MRKLVDRTVRFLSKVDKNTGPIHAKHGRCWQWTGGVFRVKRGYAYGRFLVNGSRHRAHRVSWDLFKGRVPDGKHVLHKCDNVLCVNPDHLFLGTHLDNVCDMVEKGRQSHCKGSKNGSSVLIETDVAKIKALYRCGTHSYRTLGAMFGVHFTTIYKIIKGIKWNHVPLET